jgi:hypothetical protein
MDSKRFEQIEEMYHAALACESNERSALLDHADPEVRREVELMLAQEGIARRQRIPQAQPCTAHSLQRTRPSGKWPA